MANANGWGDGASNNNIGWGKGADNAIGWGAIHADSWAGLTDIVGAPSTDPDAQAFITAASITDPTQQSAINTLVTDLKGYNIWTKMKALYPFVGGTASQHKWNLKDPRDLDAAFRLVFSGGWTHSSTGAKPNGTNAFADTKLNFNTTMQLNNAALSFYSREDIFTAVLMGCGWDSITSMISPNFASGVGEYSTINSGGNGTGVANKSGLFTISRLTSTNEIGYRNGVQYFNRTINSTSKPNYNVYIGARNYIGATQYSSNQCAFSAIHDGLTPTEAANLYTAVQAFQTTLGRSIGTQTVSDADAQAFVTNAGIVDQVEANAVNNLVIGLKADGLWTKMKAIYPMVGGSSSTMKFNLKNPLDTDAAFRLVFNGGWTFSSTGATPNGTNAYADTKFIPATNLTINSAHFSTYKRTNNLSANLQIDGVYNNTTNKAFQLLYSPSPANAIIGDVSATTYTSTNTSGMVVASRTASNLLKVFKNNSNIATGTNTITNLPTTYSVVIGARTDAGFIGYYNNLECAFASLGDGLTDTEAANFYTAVQTFQTELNRNI